jgi:hypothetical protein
MILMEGGLGAGFGVSVTPDGIPGTTGTQTEGGKEAEECCGGVSDRR